MNFLNLIRFLCGTHHPFVLKQLNALAVIAQTEGRLYEAEQLYLELLSLQKCQLGESHPDVATSLHNLALVYQAQGIAQATLWEEALAIRSEVLGSQHPFTLDTQQCLQRQCSSY